MKEEATKKVIARYMAQIGRKGGLKSRRQLTPQQASDMARVREAKKLFRLFHGRCFWSCPKEFIPSLRDVEWVADQLRRYGGAEGWRKAARLCR